MAADALTLDWPMLLGDEPRRWSLVANLPYNVAVPLVVRVLEEAPQIADVLVMVQREVGERLAAHVGDAAYGGVSVKMAYWGRARLVGRVPPSVFVPRPKVESALVRIERHPMPVGGAERPGPGTPSYDRFEAVVRAGFGKRRKMLRRSLEGLVVPEAFAATGVAPTARAEELGLDAWEALAAWRPAVTDPSADAGRDSTAADRSAAGTAVPGAAAGRGRR